MIGEWWPVVAGLLVSATAFLARWYHGRAVATAEQRGRVDEIERQRVATELGIRLERAAAARLEAEGQAAAEAARASTTAAPVTAREVDEWAKPPKGPAS